MTTYLAAVGDANDPRTWSGIPYHLLRAGRGAGLFDAGLALETGGVGWAGRRIGWNLARAPRLERPGGFQYSPAFLERLWRPARAALRGATVINCFPLYPPSLVADAGVAKWFYIDQTLTQLFDYYRVRSTIGARIAGDALARERLGYSAARGIIAHSEWAANSVIDDYGIARDKVHVVVPGANVDADRYRAWEARRQGNRGGSDGAPAEPLRMVFVGKHWRRKGLDRLLGAFRMARARGGRSRLRIIGFAAEDSPAHFRLMGGVEWLGTIDKAREPLRFLEAVSENDIGCLLSRAEAGGIALREFHALGLAVMAPDTGGSPEHALAGAALMIAPDEDESAIADKLLALEADRERLDAMKRHAWAHRREMLWEHAVGQIAAILGNLPAAAAAADCNAREV